MKEIVEKRIFVVKEWQNLGCKNGLDLVERFVGEGVEVNSRREE